MGFENVQTVLWVLVGKFTLISVNMDFKKCYHNGKLIMEMNIKSNELKLKDI